MTNFNAHFSTLRSRVALAAAALARRRACIAGCGSSSSSSARITVGNENTADNALVTPGATSSTTATGDLDHGDDAHQRAALQRSPVIAPAAGAAPDEAR